MSFFLPWMYQRETGLKFIQNHVGKIQALEEGQPKPG